MGGREKRKKKREGGNIHLTASTSFLRLIKRYLGLSGNHGNRNSWKAAKRSGRAKSILQA